MLISLIYVVFMMFIFMADTSLLWNFRFFCHSLRRFSWKLLIFLVVDSSGFGWDKKCRWEDKLYVFLGGFRRISTWTLISSNQEMRKNFGELFSCWRFSMLTTFLISLSLIEIDNLAVYSKLIGIKRWNSQNRFGFNETFYTFVSKAFSVVVAGKSLNINFWFEV